MLSWISSRTSMHFFFFKQKTAYEIVMSLEFRRVLFRSRRNARISHQETGNGEKARQHQPAELRDRDQGIVGRAAGTNRDGLRCAYAGLASFDGHVRRRLDLRALEQPRLNWFSARVGVCGSAVRPARSVSDLENACVPQETPRWRETGALWREVAALRRLVRHAAELSRWRPDHRGFWKFSGFAAAEGHSPGHKERDACSGNDF